MIWLWPCLPLPASDQAMPPAAYVRAVRADVVIHQTLREVRLELMTAKEPSPFRRVVLPLPEDAVLREVTLTHGNGTTRAQPVIAPPPILRYDAAAPRQEGLSIPLQRDGLKVDRVQVSYLQRTTLPNRDRFVLPLGHLPHLERLEVRLTVHDQAEAPTVTGFYEDAAQHDRDGAHLIQITRAAFKPEDLTVVLSPAQTTGLSTVRQEDGSLLFLLAGVTLGDQERRRANRFGKILLLWDASYSMADQDPTLRLALLKEIIARFRPREIQLRTIREKISMPRAFPATAGKADTLIAHLEKMVYDGGTDLGPALAARGGDFDAVLLFSDGRNSIGTTARPQYQAPVYVFSDREHVHLRKIAKAGGGLLLPIDPAHRDAVLTRMARHDARMADFEDPAPAFSNLHITRAAEAGRYHISGRLAAGVDSAQLVMGLGPQPWSRRHRFTISANPTNQERAAAWWALQELQAGGADQPALNKALRLARKHKVVPQGLDLSFDPPRTGTAKKKGGAYRDLMLARHQRRVSFLDAQPADRTRLMNLGLPPLGEAVEEAAPILTLRARTVDIRTMAEGDYADALENAQEKDRYQTYLDLRATHGRNPAFLVDAAEFFFQNNNRAAAYRIASNLVELSEDSPQLVRRCAHLHQRYGAWSPAVNLYQRLLDLEPGQARPYRELALTLVERGMVWQAARRGARAATDYKRALGIYQNLIDQAWSLDAQQGAQLFGGLEQLVLLEYNGLPPKLARLGSPGLLDLPDPMLSMDPRADLRMVLSWDNSDARVSLEIHEGETIVNRDRPLAPSGGVLTADNLVGPYAYVTRSFPTQTLTVYAACRARPGITIGAPIALKLMVFRDFGGPNEEVEIISQNIRTGETLNLFTLTGEREPASGSER